MIMPFPSMPLSLIREKFDDPLNAIIDNIIIQMPGLPYRQNL